MYKAYIETLQQRLDIADNIEDADVVLFLGAWSYQGFRLAQRSRKMGIPYIVCPLGDISERNCHNPAINITCKPTSVFSSVDIAKPFYSLTHNVLELTPLG